MKLRFMRYALCVIVAATIPACTIREQTVTAPAIVSRQASLDGNVANSGIVGYNNGWVVTANWLKRYQSLLAKYGDRLIPARKTGDMEGIVDAYAYEVGVENLSIEGPKYRVTAQVLARHIKMNQWAKREKE